VDTSHTREAERVVDSLGNHAWNRSREQRNIGMLIAETTKGVKLFLISVLIK
jgi:hypothetical protein